MTAYPSPKTTAEAVREDADDYLIKPFSINYLPFFFISVCTLSNSKAI
jgi:DNA-binding response OmpR family regulator